VIITRVGRAAFPSAATIFMSHGRPCMACSSLAETAPWRSAGAGAVKREGRRRAFAFYFTKLQHTTRKTRSKSACWGPACCVSTKSVRAFISPVCGAHCSTLLDTPTALGQCHPGPRDTLKSQTFVQSLMHVPSFSRSAGSLSPKLQATSAQPPVVDTSDDC
jgi:hypothetical protein